MKQSTEAMIQDIENLFPVQNEESNTHSGSQSSPYLEMYSSLLTMICSIPSGLADCEETIENFCASAPNDCDALIEVAEEAKASATASQNSGTTPSSSLVDN